MPAGHIRQAAPPEHATLAALAGVIFEHLGNYNQVLADWLAAPGAVAWVWDDGGAILGGAVVGFYQENDRPVVDLVALLVVPSMRGQGLATALLAEALAAVDRVGTAAGVADIRLTVEASNGDAQRLYQRVGFVVDDTRTAYPCGQAAWRMVRPVPLPRPTR